MRARPFLVLVAGYAILTNAGAEPAKDQKPKSAALTDALGDPLPEGAIARLGTLRFKHTPVGDPTIDGAYFSPDGKKIVSLVYGAGSIRVWDSATPH